MDKPEHISVGMVGEAIAARFLETRGYRVIAKNYRKPWGEIDIIARKGDILHFIEVKAGGGAPFVFGKDTIDSYRPEENVHPKKLKRLVQTIQTYLKEERPRCSAWHLDVLVVLLDRTNKKARVRIIPDVLS